MEYEKRIREIVKKRLNESVEAIKDSSKGDDHRVFIVRTNKRDVVIKFPLKSCNNAKIQSWIYSKWNKLNIPVPKPLATGKGYLIETRILGKDFKDCKLSEKDQNRIMYELGKTLKKMHSVKVKNYGPMRKEGVGTYSSLKKYYCPIFVNSINKVEKHNLISKKDLNLVKKYYSTNIDVLNYYDPRLIHFDINPRNFMVNREKFSGIIDVGDAIAGDPMSDFARLNGAYYGRDLIQSLYSGYGEVDERRITFYLVGMLLHHIYKYSITVPKIETKERRINTLRKILKSTHKHLQ